MTSLNNVILEEIFFAVHTHKKIFSKSYLINPKSDCIYHFPIDLEHKRTCPFLFQINRKMVNTIWFRVDLIRFRKDFSAYTLLGSAGLCKVHLLQLGEKKKKEPRFHASKASMLVGQPSYMSQIFNLTVIIYTKWCTCTFYPPSPYPFFEIKSMVR